MVSMNDIAKKLKLSRTSVSNILNNREVAKNYKQETIDKVIKTAEEMGYIPNNMAISLMRGTTMTLAIVVPDLANTYYVNIIKEVEHLASKLNYQLYIFTSEESITKENSIINFLSRQRVDGLLLAPVSFKDSLNFSNIPFDVVIFDRSIRRSRFPTVTIDNYKYASNLINNNVNKHYDEIIFVAGSKDDYTVHERLKGINDSLHKKDLNISKIYYNVFDDEDSYKQINKYLSYTNKPQNKSFLIILSSNFFSLGVLKSLKKYNIEGSKILGFEKVGWGELFDVDINYIDQPTDKIAVTAFDLLIKQIDGIKVDSIELNSLD